MFLSSASRDPDMPLPRRLRVGRHLSHQFHDLASAENGHLDRGAGLLPAKQSFELVPRMIPLPHEDPVDREDDVTPQHHLLILNLEAIPPCLQSESRSEGVLRDPLHQDARALRYVQASQFLSHSRAAPSETSAAVSRVARPATSGSDL